MSSVFAPFDTAAASQPLQRAHRVLAVGWWLFFAAFFLAPDKHALRMSYYLLVALPALVWIRPILREVDWRDPLWLSIASTLAFLSLSAFWGADAGDSHALRAVKIMLVLLICFLVTRFLSRAGLLPIRFLTGVILVLATAVAAFNLVDNALALLSGQEPFALHMRLAGAGQYDNPLQYGGIMGCSALVALCAFYRETRRRYQVLLLFVLAVLTVSLVLTMSRGPILYFLIVSTLIAAWYRARWRRSLLLAAAAAAAVVSLLMHPTVQSMIEFHVERDAFRPQIWSSVIAEMPGKELFGQGWRDDQSVYTPAGRFGHPHNFLLGIFRFSGLVGLLLFLTLTGLLFQRCLRLRPEIAVPLGAWLLYGICLHLTNGRFPVSAPGNDWFFYWLPAALVFGFDHAANRARSTARRSEEADPAGSARP